MLWKSDYKGNVWYIVAPSNRKDQINRIADIMKGRKAIVKTKHTKGHSIVKIY